jgi:anti-anti-sigma regulatory factor
VNTPSGISTGTLHGVAWLTVEGRGNFQNSPELRGLVRSGIDEGTNRVVVDLQRCSGMDSTFMGMLSCVAVKLEDAGGCLHVVNAGGKNGELLRGLGLDEVFTVEDGTELVEQGACPCPGVAAEPLAMAAVPKTERSKQDQLAICLEAHEALANLDQANAEKFADVITLMRQQGRPEQAVH